MSDHSSKTNPTTEKQSTTHRPPPTAQPTATTMSPASTLQSAVMDPASAQPAEILTLQQNYGNQAVQRLLARRTVQAKLNVGPAGDAYEQEADRVAEQVMTKPLVQRQEDEEEIQTKPLVQRQEDEEEIQTKPLAASISPLVQRQEDEEEVQTKPLVQRQEDEEEIQTKREDPREGFEAGRDVEGQLRAQQGTGRPLPAETRHFMEPRFGADFSGVRVHTGGEANQLNRQLSAQAFTHGQDIYVGEGKYNPGSADGQRLLAHELTHVVQQTGGVQRLQRLMSYDEVVTEAGAPSKGFLGIGRSVKYETILGLLKRYQNQIATDTVAVSMVGEKLADAGNEILDKLETACTAYLGAKKHKADGADIARRPTILKLVADIKKERAALQTISTNFDFYKDMSPRQALFLARMQGAMTSAEGTKAKTKTPTETSKLKTTFEQTLGNETTLMGAQKKDAGTAFRGQNPVSKASGDYLEALMADYLNSNFTPKAIALLMQSAKAFLDRAGSQEQYASNHEQVAHIIAQYYGQFLQDVFGTSLPPEAKNAAAQLYAAVRVAPGPKGTTVQTDKQIATTVLRDVVLRGMGPKFYAAVGAARGVWVDENAGQMMIALNQAFITHSNGLTTTIKAKDAAFLRIILEEVNGASLIQQLLLTPLIVMGEQQASQSLQQLSNKK